MEADTVANPGTMMIHPQDAFLATVAMVAPFWLDNFTFEAITDFVQQFDLFSWLMMDLLWIDAPFLSQFFHLGLHRCLFLNLPQ